MVISSSRNGGGKVNSTGITGSNIGGSSSSSSSFASGGDTTGTVAPSNTTGVVGNGAKTTFPHPRRMMSGNLNHSHKTKVTPGNNNHTLASSSGIKHNGLPMGPSSSSSSGHAKSIYLDALQILNEETMLQACSLLLAPIAVNSNDDEPEQTADTIMISINDSKNSVTDDNDTMIIETTGTVATEKVGDGTNPGTNEILPREEASSTQRRPTAKLPPPPPETTCPELKQLQQIYEQCRQAVRTLETAMRSSPPPRILPHLPLSTATSAAFSSSSNTASIVPGMISGRTKIVGGRGGDGSLMNRTSGGIRTGSMKRPLSGMSMPSTSSSSVSATNHPQHQSIHQPNHSNSKGLFGSMTTGSNNGVLRRHRLERERSDSSVSITSATSVASTTTNKKSRISMASDAATISQPTSADEALIPPPSARHFLAMLNNSDNKKAATTTPMPQSSPASTSRRKNTIDLTPTNAASTETTNHDDDPVSADPSNQASRQRRRPSPEQASPIKATTTKTFTRMQPPRSSRK